MKARFVSPLCTMLFIAVLGCGQPARATRARPQLADLPLLPTLTNVACVVRGQVSRASYPPPGGGEKQTWRHNRERCPACEARDFVFERREHGVVAEQLDQRGSCSKAQLAIFFRGESLPLVQLPDRRDLRAQPARARDHPLHGTQRAAQWLVAPARPVLGRGAMNEPNARSTKTGTIHRLALGICLCFGVCYI